MTRVTPTAFNYDLIAVDLDGTLFDERGRVGKANAEAIARARDAGLRVVIATGRGLAESRHAFEATGTDDPAVVGGGAIVADPASGGTLHRFPMHTSIVRKVVSILDERGLCALVLKDGSAAGHDYLVVTGEAQHELDPVSEWWFSELGVSVKFARTLEADEHPEHTIRVGVCMRGSAGAALERELRDELGEAAMVMHFPAVAAPEHAREWGAGETAAILEVFDARVTKWTALGWLCDELGVDRARTVAIGDGVNDVAMLRGAGLGVAVANAGPEAVDASDARTEAHTDDGVARAIDRVLDGTW